MKTKIFPIISCLLFLFACEKYDFQYSFETPSKLLVSVKRIGKQTVQTTNFKYDSLNHLIEVERNYADLLYRNEYYRYDSQNRLIEKIHGEYLTSYEYMKSGILAATILHYKSAKDGYEWEQKTEYQYSHGKINQAVVFSREGKVIHQIRYKYDSRGNTIERTYYGNSENKNFMMSQEKYTYDTKVNPCVFSGLSLGNSGFMADISQGNNPTYLYSYNSVMSSFPPEFNISYEYDSEGLPLKAEMIHVNGQMESIVIEFDYKEKIGL